MLKILRDQWGPAEKDADDFTTLQEHVIFVLSLCSNTGLLQTSFINFYNRWSFYNLLVKNSFCQNGQFELTLTWMHSTFMGIFDYIKLGKVSSVLKGSDDGSVIEISCLTNLTRWLPTFSPYDGNLSSFWNIVFFLEYQIMDKLSDPEKMRCWLHNTREL
jgi:hypothetical protein